MSGLAKVPTRTPLSDSWLGLDRKVLLIDVPWKIMFAILENKITKLSVTICELKTKVFWTAKESGKVMLVRRWREGESETVVKVGDKSCSVSAE